MRGPQVDLMVMPPGEAGTYRIHFTGSKEHNVRLRAMARDQGWSLSEKGFLRIGEDGEPLTGDAAELRTFATEAEAYAFLGLPFIEPELREDAGEIEAALAGRLPALDRRWPTCAATCTATPTGPTATSRSRSWPRRARRARLRLPGPDRPHAVARRSPAGLTPDRVAEQARGHRRAQRPLRGRGGGRHARRRRRRPRASACSTAASSRSAPTARSTSRTTCWPASTSSSRRSTSARRQTRAELTAADAQRDPQPARRRHRPSVRPQDRRARRPRPRLGRRSTPRRRGPGTALEMNGSPPRLDLAVERARRAVAHGLPRWRSTPTPTTSTSSTTSAGGSARRAARGSSPDAVVNTRSRADLLAWAAGKPGRV